MRRYRSEANERWSGFEHRPGDIVISTRSKCPLDVAVSLFHHRRNLDRDRMDALQGRSSPPPSEPLGDWIDGWIDADAERVEDLPLDSLAGLAHHVGDAWTRRSDGNVVLLHYQDLTLDLDGQMRLLAERLARTGDLATAPSGTGDRWPALVAAATFAAMATDAERNVPDHLGVLQDPRAFFRSGRSGEGRATFAAATVARYEQRLAELAPPDLVAWLDR